MKIPISIRIRPDWLIQSAMLLMLGLAQATNSWAFFQPGPPSADPNFEIDVPSANALDQSTYDGDDWETIYRCKVGGSGYDATMCAALGGLNANLVATTGILDDPYPYSIFWKGGSKDTNDISQWWYKDGSVPDKDQILHAGAAAYQVSDAADGDQLIMYLFADRYSNDGDALMGAWFFQNEVGPDPEHPGQFIGVHKNGDVVWFGDFSGGGVVASLRIAIWNDPNLPNPKAACFSNSEPTVPYQIGNTKLCVVAEGAGGAGTGYFASVNNQDEDSPWPYTPKSGTENKFPYNTFMEGGINITELLGSTPCFSSFLIETRSSTSESAQLKDFVLGSINTCKISVKKTCSASLAADASSIDDHFVIKVKNEGFANITSVSLTDDHYPATDHMWTYDSSPIGPGAEVTVGDYTVNTTTQELSNSVTAIGHAGTADTAPATDSVTCDHVNVTTGLEVIKDCDKTMLEVDNNGTTGTTADDKLWVKIFYKGTVCNKGNVKVTGLTATDTENGGSPLDISSALSTTTLNAPGVGPAGSDCASFSGSYYPNLAVGSGITAQDNPTGGCVEAGVLQHWSDTVDASGTAALGGGTVNATADSADCPLCPNCTAAP